MSKVPIRNHLIEQGTDWSESFQILNPNKTVMSLAGCSIKSHARRIPDKTTPVAFSFTFAINLTTNTITVSLSAATSGALTVGKDENDALSKFYYDYDFIDSLNKTKRIQKGTVIIPREITGTES